MGLVSGNKLYKSIAVNNPEYNVVAFLDDDESKKMRRLIQLEYILPANLNILRENMTLCYFHCHVAYLQKKKISFIKNMIF